MGVGVTLKVALILGAVVMVLSGCTWAPAAGAPATPAALATPDAPGGAAGGVWLPLLRGGRGGATYGDGVPQYPVDYQQDVETWWANHPLNPDNPGGLPIGAIRNLAGLPTINVRERYGSNLQAAIDALPPEGGTLFLEPGVYDGFRVIGRSNVHIVSDLGATIRNPGDGPADDRDSNQIAGCAQALDYGPFNVCAFHDDPACRACLRDRVQNIYLRNVTLDGAGLAVEGVGLHAVRGVVFDNVTFQGYYDPEAHHNGLLGGNAWLDNVWCRGCRFVGEGRWAVYLDGAHASGIIHSEVGAFGSGSLLFLSNNDFDIDLDGDGAYAPHEVRQANYIVIEGNTFAGSHMIANVEGAHVLIKDNLVTGSAEYLAWLNAPSSFRDVPLVDYYGARIVGNQVERVSTLLALQGATDAHARAGHYELRNNRVGSLRGALVQESGRVDGPNLLCANVANGAALDPPCAPRSPAGGAASPGPPLPDTPSARPFPLGVLEDGNLQSPATFGAMIDDLHAHGLDAALFVNTWARQADLLDVSDAKGLDVYYALHDLYEQWYRAPVSTDLATARQIIYPLVDAVRAHPSLRGYNLADEPTLDLRDRIALAVQAVRERDPDRVAAPTLIGIGRADAIYAAARPDVLLLDVYPYASANAPCDTTLAAFGYPSLDAVAYIRAIRRAQPADAPWWVILQTHRFAGGDPTFALRVPTAAELRLEHWLAIGEGATGIFWFVYSSQQGWVGLADSPTLFGEVASLARRIGPLRGLLATLRKAPDRYEAAGSAGPAYASTLTTPSGDAHYVVLVNRACAPQFVTVRRPEGSPGWLRDLETGEVHRLGSRILLGAGDGRLLQVLPSP